MIQKTHPYAINVITLFLLAISSCACQNNDSNPDSSEPVGAYDTLRISGNTVLILRPDSIKFHSLVEEGHDGIYEVDSDFGFGITQALNEFKRSDVVKEFTTLRFITIEDCSGGPVTIDRDSILYGFLLTGPNRNVELNDKLFGAMYYSEVFETFFPKSKESKNSIQAENCYCNIETYVEYKDSLNIYDQPDGEIIRSFRFEDDSIYEGGNGVVLDSAYNGWFRILRLESDQNWNDITGGWIASQNIVIGTNNYSGHPIPLLQNPEDGADSTGAILQESYLHPTNCQGAWVYVKSEESDHSEGWLSPLHQCNNPYTNCN